MAILFAARYLHQPKTLIHVNDQRLNTVWQQKVFTKLLGLCYHIVYKKGQDNNVADALPHRTHPDGICCAISMATAQWCSNIVQGYKSDPQAQSLLAKLSMDAAAVISPFGLTDGIIHFKNRVWVGNNLALQQQLIQAFHSSPLGGHSGIPATIKHLQELFAWLGL